jgi:hypothetical protein
MHDGSGQLASTVRLVLKDSEGKETVFETNNNPVSQYVMPNSGVYTVYCTHMDGSLCPGLKSTPDDSTIIVAGPACYECPSTFKCYTNGTNFRWFVPGYNQTGYIHDNWVKNGVEGVVEDSECSSRNVAKPTFKGKAKGDSNCDGVIDPGDYSIWRKEYIDQIKTNNRWESDTNCNGPDPGDYSNWRRSYLDLNN